MRQLRFLSRRLLFLCLVLPAVTLITFMVSRVIPGDPVSLMAGPLVPMATRERLRAEWGLDKPLPVQYLIYLEHLLHGDLGKSFYTGRSVGYDLAAFFPATLELSTAALCIGLPIAVVGGVTAAARKDTVLDYTIRVAINLGLALPVFWLGILLILVFSGQLGWLPSLGRISPQVMIPPHITGLYVIDSVLAGDTRTLADTLAHLALPAFCLAIGVVAPIARITRTSMLWALQQDFIRTARAKGVRARRVTYHHALPNALLPAITSIGLVYGLLLGGAVVTETVFSWPGIGLYVTTAILSLDFQPVISLTLLSAVAYAFINMIVDIAYGFIDPRAERPTET